MPRRKLRWVVEGLAVLLVALGAFVFWPRASEPSRITRENFDRIRKGMSRAEVEAILGPLGDHATGPVGTTDGGRFYVGGVSPQMRLGPRDPGFWVSDEGFVEVDFDNNETVVNRHFIPGVRISQGPFDYLRRQWRKWFPE